MTPAHDTADTSLAIHPGRAWRASSAIGAHTVIDTFSFVLIALMPVFATRLDLSDKQAALLLGVGSVTSGVIQPIVAWASDRLNTRSLGTIAMVIAVVCIGLMGHARSFGELLTLQALGAMGVGAFHPPAAAAVGALAGSRRTLGMSIFFLAGMIGGMTGNFLSPKYADAFGVQALVWLIVPGLLVTALLALAIHPVSHRAHDAHETHASLTADDRRERWQVVWILYAGNVIRFTVNMALVYLIIAWSRRFVLAGTDATSLNPELALQASQLNGPLQASMQVGMGGAGLVAGLVLRPAFEKRALFLLPMLGAAAIVLIPYAERASFIDTLDTATLGRGAETLVFALCVLAGVGFGGLVPVTMAIAQRMLPHRTSLASGLMLGGAWCFAAVGPTIAERLHHALGLERAFLVTAAALAAAGIIAIALPSRVLSRLAHA